MVYGGLQGFESVVAAVAVGPVFLLLGSGSAMVELALGLGSASASGSALALESALGSGSALAPMVLALALALALPLAAGLTALLADPHSRSLQSEHPSDRLLCLLLLEVVGPLVLVQ